MRIIFVILLPIIFSCSYFQNFTKRNDCIENKKFKKDFFSQIEIVEHNLFLRQDSTFRQSLIFISNYAPVSFYETINYARIYPPQALERDKIIWLKWYEENKCKNIQLKKSHPIPEQYKEFFED